MGLADMLSLADRILLNESQNQMVVIHTHKKGSLFQATTKLKKNSILGRLVIIRYDHYH